MARARSSSNTTSLSTSINHFVQLKSCVLNGKREELQSFLKNSEYLNLINEPDSLEDGRTLLHMASAPERRDVEIIKILLSHGADPSQADNQDKLPLHYVVSEGTRCFCNNCTTKAEECTLILLEANSSDEVVNKKCDDNFKTPLYYAADSRLSNCAILLLKYGADINIRPNEADDLVTWLLKQIPEVFETILDQSMEMDTAAGQGQVGKKLRIDFGLFLGEPKTCQRAHSVTDLEVPRREGEFLNQVLTLSKHEGRNKILSHPVTEIFMYKKNRALQIAFLVPQIFRFALAIIYTLFVFGFFLYNCPYYRDNSPPDVNQTSFHVFPNVKSVRIPLTSYIVSVQIEDQNSWPNNSTESESIENCHPSSVIKWLAGIVTFLSGIMFLYLIIKFALKPKYAAKSSSFWLWVLYVISSTITLMPVFFGNDFDESGEDGIQSFYYPTAAIGTFLVWSMLLGELGRIPSVGVHLEMLNKVIMTVLFCIFAYGLLVLAFAFGFHIMFPKNELFSSPYLSFVKVLQIMVGDTDYDGIFKERKRPGANEDLLYWIPAHLFYAAFLILITIVFMNLLVGLAVSDIQKLKRKAKMAKAIGFIELLHLVEINLYSSIWDSSCLSWTKGLLTFLKRKLSVVLENRRGEIQWYIEIPALVNEGRSLTSLSSLRAFFRTDILPEKLCRRILDRYKSSCNC